MRMKGIFKPVLFRLVAVVFGLLIAALLVITAGLTRAGISHREPYPEFLKAAVAGGHPFNDPDNHFGAEGHALFAKFLTDTDEAWASVDYYAHQ
jgi:hypothetical protein